jgi:hypothetical protein
MRPDAGLVERNRSSGDVLRSVVSYELAIKEPGKPLRVESYSDAIDGNTAIDAIIGGRVALTTLKMTHDAGYAYALFMHVDDDGFHKQLPTNFPYPGDPDSFVAGTAVFAKSEEILSEQASKWIDFERQDIEYIEDVIAGKSS